MATSTKRKATVRATGTTGSSSLDRVLHQYGASIVKASTPQRRRQTHAGAALNKLFEKHGEAHVRDVLTLILETGTDGSNDFALDEPVILAVSSLLLAHPASWTRNASCWLEVFDRVDLVELHSRVKINAAAVAPKAAIATALFAELAGWSELGRKPQQGPRGYDPDRDYAPAVDEWPNKIAGRLPITA